MKSSGSVVEGSLVAAFEREFAALVGGRQCVAVQEGNTALRLSLVALGVIPGDEVIVPSYGPAAAVEAVRLAGATPVFADIDPHTFCLDPDAVAAAISWRTVAIIAGHRFGHPAPVRRLADVARRHGLALVEDASEACGAELDREPVGTFGALAAFSLAVVTEDPRLARRIRELRTPDIRPTEESAVAGRGELERLAGFAARRRANARVFDTALKGVRTPYVAAGARHVYHRYVVRVPGNGRPDRDAFARALATRGVEAGVPVPTPLHRIPAFRMPVDLPQTERAAAETLSLPVHPLLTEREVERIVSACNALGGLL
ncbi:DegT/DnrJ/EryC1/StrS family aminotransferase [Streptantibioticus rubrisoli]|uniref:DegT/DnrJ/EryC1/StrS family aminotransferase n=1 Tax=Streptantibioticus rubrisoli TaxID=1387313 RepID=A0ABT1PI92_9ACTN|nr:DegT/DnrJ/EryC1/StrS family aminotransferase [Streptantibioticus rubrisoli]MCQ4045079.1 DegT/DnrJ/EryC1/StrS family aminotransferase [Streptantibioticus rubrisoli]